MGDDVGQSIVTFSHVDIIIENINRIFWIENHDWTILVGGQLAMRGRSLTYGFYAFIPVVNACMLCKLAKREWYFGFLFFVPLVNIAMSFIVFADIAKRYGKGTGFTIGMIFLPMFFFPILGFTGEIIKEVESKKKEIDLKVA
jgi:hypothetical protein